MYGFGSLRSAATALTALAPRAFSPSNPRARTLTAGERRAVMSPSTVFVSKLGIRGTNPFGAMR
jgi:hypothetical protein